MFKTIALAIDGSDHSHKAVALAAELAKLSKGKVVVVHVREHDATKGQPWELETEEAAKAIVADAEEAIKKNDAVAEGYVIRAIHGKAAQAIVDSVREHGADTIVMGSRGLGDLTGLVLGSVAHKVIHLSDVPVLIAR